MANKSLHLGYLIRAEIVRQTWAEFSRSNSKGSRGFESPCTFVAVPSHRLFESSWSNGIADQKSLDALSTSPQAGFLNRSEPVDPVGNAFLYVWWLGGNMNTAALLGVPRISLRFERLARTRAPARLTVDARPVGSCAASASTGVMRHHRRPKRKRRWRSGKRLSDLRRHRLGE